MESFIGWIGGKRALRRAILERFPDDEVGRYIEVFGGAAWVLFAKEKKANQLEVYNDINGNLVNAVPGARPDGHPARRPLLLCSQDQLRM